MQIVVGYDGSNAAKEALDAARRYAKAFNGNVDVITSMAKGTSDEQPEILQAERELEYARSVFEKDNISAESHLLIRGLTPGEDIVKFADEQRSDLIVVGVKRRSKVGKLLMGSTAQYVIIKAACPVLAVK
jgi:nucleotide-binding universal stress UspA family protein